MKKATTGTKKEVYIDRMANQLREWSADIDELERKVEGAGTDFKVGLDVRLHELKYKREELSRKLQELRGAGDLAWETMKGGVENAWHELTGAVKEARDKFRKAA